MCGLLCFAVCAAYLFHPQTKRRLHGPCLQIRGGGQQENPLPDFLSTGVTNPETQEWVGWQRFVVPGALQPAGAFRAESHWRAGPGPGRQW